MYFREQYKIKAVKETEKKMYDILIAGSGPAGLTAAIYAARANFSFIIAEKEFIGSGTVNSAEQINNYPGLQGISGLDLGEKLRSHATALGAEFKTAEITKLSREGEHFISSLSSGEIIESKTVLYAAGTRHRPLEISGAKLAGVSYCAVCDGALYRNKSVAVIGGGDTALADSLYLAKASSEVYLIHRRSEFRAAASLVEQAKNNDRIKIITEAVPLRILGENKVSGIELKCGEKTETVEVSGVFTAIGTIPNTEILKGTVELDSSGYIIADESGVTSLTGFFAAGDVRTKALRQIVTACSDGANCVNSIENYLMNN